MKIPLSLLGIIVVCYSCSSTNLMSLNVTEPATVSLPPNAKSAAVVNRSLAADDSRAVDAIHRTLSPESKDLQAAGAGASLTGLTDELIRSNRFDSVKKIGPFDHGSCGVGVIPVYLSWDSVEKICRENHVDVLFLPGTFRSRIDGWFKHSELCSGVECENTGRDRVENL
jgi:Family of unknown function (DUF6340)